MKVETGTGRSLFRLGMCDIEDIEYNMRMMQKLHDVIGNPVPTDDPDAPTAVPGVQLIPFQLVEAIGDTTAGLSLGALVLDNAGATISGETVTVYDPFDLWSAGVVGDQGVGVLIKHPTSGGQVVLAIDHITAGGAGTDTYKVKVSGTDGADFLQDQLDSAGGYGGDALDTDTEQAVEFVSDTALIYARTPREFRVKVNTSDPAASYLEDAFTNADKSTEIDAISSGLQQVFFATSADDDTMFSYTAEGGGGSATQQVHDLVAEEDIATGASGDATLQTTSGCTPSDSTTETVCNLATGKKIWSGSEIKAYLADDGTYIAISSNAATTAVGTIATASNAPDYNNASVTSPNGLSDFLPGTTITGVVNTLGLEIAAGSTVVIAWDNSSAVWRFVSAKQERSLAKIGKTNEEIAAMATDTLGSGEVSIYEIDPATGDLTDTTDNEDWWNLAEATIASGTWVQAKPFEADDGTVMWIIDWEECDA